MTDLWPVSRCHVDRLFLSRRKMHSLPFERNTAEKSVRARGGAREEEKDGTAELKTGRILVFVVVVDARWKNLFRNGHMSRSRKAVSSSSPSPHPRILQRYPEIVYLLTSVKYVATVGEAMTTTTTTKTTKTATTTKTKTTTTRHR